MRSLVVGLLDVYRLVISPALPRSCRFYPSCSQYAREAVLKHGILRGIALGAARLVRCNPWNPGGVDLVP
ncbi:MAG: membrane protein insertion efficiency factor YidD [Candidatus Baltobacteraceae bacterium]